MASPGEAPVAGELPYLLNQATQKLYVTNAFRITGLSISATDREIARLAEKIKVEEKLGREVGALSEVLPLEPPPRTDAIRDAAHRLRDPEKRLIEEFFWVWPDPVEQGTEDKGLRALKTGKVYAALAHWRLCAQRTEPDPIAVHNLAVVSHLVALDHENGTPPPPAPGLLAANPTALWKASIGYWRQLLGLQTFWALFAARITLRDEQLHPEARNCPHGRNTSLLLSLRELETRFQRKK